MDVVSQFIKFTRYDENFVVRTGVSCQKHPHKIRAWCTIIPNLCHKVDLLLNNLLIFKVCLTTQGYFERTVNVSHQHCCQ